MWKEYGTTGNVLIHIRPPKLTCLTQKAFGNSRGAAESYSSGGRIGWHENNVFLMEWQEESHCEENHMQKDELVRKAQLRLHPHGVAGIMLW